MLSVRVFQWTKASPATDFRARADEWQRRARKRVPNAPEAAEKALELVAGGVRPVVIGDGSDRTGDSTHVMRELLTRGKERGACGGPLQVTGKVEWLGMGEFVLTGPMGKGSIARGGPSAVLDIGDGNKIVVTSRPLSVIDEQGIVSFGLDFNAFDIMVLRSRVHHRACYETVAGAPLDVDAPGCGPADLSVFEYHNLPGDIFPIGRNWRK